MDIPPLAGKIAALSLGAVPVSYALNHASELSQCVRGGGGQRAALGCVEGAGERRHPRWGWLRTNPEPLAIPARGLGQNPQPGVLFPLDPEAGGWGRP